MRLKRSMGIRGHILLIGAVLLLIAFIPVGLLLFVGMMPTIVAGLIDKTKERVKSLTVGFLNFAGCYPYILLILNAKEEPLSVSYDLVTDPYVIVVIYGAALLGYLVEWSVSGIVAALLFSTGEKRLVDIKKEQKDLVAKWGKEVTGEYELNKYGFPISDKIETNAEEN